MDKKTKKLLLVAGAGAAAFGIYYWYTNYGPGATVVVPTSSGGSMMPTNQQLSSPLPAQLSQSATGWVNQHNFTLPNGTLWSTWFWSHVAPTLSATDAANLEAIIVYFNNNTQPPQSLSLWWDGFIAANGLT
jgi:hypothetical protein